MSSKYADLGRPVECWRCQDSVQAYPDPDGQEIVLDVRSAPTGLVPVELRWRINGNGICLPLGWADPTDTVRVSHDPICAGNPRPDLALLRTYLSGEDIIAQGLETVLTAFMERLPEQNRHPTADDVRTVQCPHCEAIPDSPCTDSEGLPRPSNHRERVAEFHQARYDASPVARLAGRTVRLFHPSRSQVRTITCPRCLAPPRQPCRNNQERQPRAANHKERVDAYTGDT